MRMHIVYENPNDVCGGGGCLCHELQHPDTHGPFVVFPENEMENPQSPHAVMCSDCVCQAFVMLDEDPETVEGSIDED